jgi:predicted TIM-barrel fold metal-dependent hydrolase
MVHRLSWFREHPGLAPGRILDTQVCDVSLSRKVPGPFRHARVAPATAGQRPEETEAAKLSDLLEDMDRARVAASLVVLHEETDEFFRLAAQHPRRLFGLAYYDSLSPRRGLERVQALCGEHPAQILRVMTAMPRFGQDPRLRDFTPLYEYYGERRLPIQFRGGGDTTGEEADRPMGFAVLARTYLRLTVICRYTGCWRGETLALLRRLPNLFLQVDGLSVHALLRAAGGHKLLFGSDWQGREGRYFERVEAVRRLPWWQRQDVGWRTAVRVYGPRILSPSSHNHPQPSSR